MKNKLIISKIVGLSFVLAINSCATDGSCEYNESGCTENAPFVGYMATTMGGINNGDEVVKIFNANPTQNAPFGGDWFDTALGANQIQQIATPQLTKANVGQVFGIALDQNGGIYVSATNVYIDYGFVPTTFGPGGSAGIYYTNLSTPASTSTLVKTLSSASANTVGTNTIPNTGVGYNSIGNIAYDKKNNQLFATNLEDGRIYRINPNTGIVLSIFDPFAIDTGIAGIAPLGEQNWGIGVFTESGTTKVYFAKSNLGNVKQIWSIALDSSGEFVATQVGTTKLFNDTASSSILEIASVGGTQPKITDIAFSQTGRMLLAERGDPHKSVVFEFVKSGTWGTGNNFYVGGVADLWTIPFNTIPGGNSAGGVDYGRRQTTNNSFLCDDVVWATGNFMPLQLPPYNTSTTKLVYGVEGIKASGNTVPANGTTDLYIDYNHAYFPAGAEKGSIGDVEMFKPNCGCN